MVPILKDIVNFFFPTYCVSCGERLSTQEQYLCMTCIATLPRTHAHQYQRTILEQAFWGRIPVEKAVSFFFH